jgi:hypothetical protein
MEGVDREISPFLISAQKEERAKRWYGQLHALATNLPPGKKTTVPNEQYFE